MLGGISFSGATDFSGSTGFTAATDGADGEEGGVKLLALNSMEKPFTVILPILMGLFQPPVKNPTQPIMRPTVISVKEIFNVFFFMLFSS